MVILPIKCSVITKHSNVIAGMAEWTGAYAEVVILVRAVGLRSPDQDFYLFVHKYILLLMGVVKNVNIRWAFNIE